jgi:hypothetical protein
MPGSFLTEKPHLHPPIVRISGLGPKNTSNREPVQCPK